MKTKILLIAINVLLSLSFLPAQTVRTIHVASPGTLETLVGSDKNTITGLTLTGTINAADFTPITQMKVLKNLDMSELNIDNGTIPEGTFQNRVMEKIILPINLRSIGRAAFRNTTLLSLDFTHCHQLEEIGAVAFYDISLTQNTTLDLSHTKLSRCYGNGHDYNNGTFGGFNSHVILPVGMTILPANSFQGFKGTLELPSTLQEIGVNAFRAASLPQQLTLPSSVTTIHETAFYQADIPLGIQLPSGLKKIGLGCFQAAKLPSLDFTHCHQLEEIGAVAFYDISLTQNTTLDLSHTKLSRCYGNGHD
ncbi:MAG TPA: hypothetical protein DIT04_06570, partial [Dysgonomonas sp.]|nr:hypothetical protein [Dysgonomonas sp.]